MSKSPWGNIGAWAAEAERAEAEEKEQAAAEAAAAAAAAAAGKDTQSFPSLKDAVNTKQKKKTKMTLQEFTMQSTYTPAGGYGSGSTSRLTPEEMLRLPTGPKERSAEEMQYGRLGGGFSNYGSRGMGPPPGRGRDRDTDGEGSWGAGNRRSYGGFDDDRRGPPSRASDFDQPSRADEADNWASSKKSLPMQSLDSGSARSNRYGSLGTGGGISRADGDENWGASKKSNVAPPPPPARSWFPDSRPEPERWSREANNERQRLVLDPPRTELGSENVNEIVVKMNKPNPFGAARPREEVLAEKGLDWKKLDNEIEVKKAIGSRPTSSQSSRPGSSQSARSEGTALQGGMVEGGVVKPKPKVNPFGDAKPREVLLEEKGLDWRKIDLDLDHRRVDRPETEEEKNLKEEIEQLRKEVTQCSEEDKTNLQNVINQKERELELLIRDLDDKVRFQKPIQRPGSGPGRGAGHPDRTLSQPAFYEDRRAGDQMDRPRSRGGGDAWVRPSDQMERPRSRSGVDAWARPNEQVERPRSRGGGDARTRPGDERRSFQGGRGGYFGSRESDRTRSGDRW